MPAPRTEPASTRPLLPSTEQSRDPTRRASSLPSLASSSDAAALHAASSLSSRSVAPSSSSPARAGPAGGSLAGAWWTAASFIFLSHLVVLYMLVTTHHLPPLRLLLLTALQAWLQLLGITAGYHRLWSHRAYSASLPLRIFLAVIGLQAFQGSALWWVLRHRLHHRFTDTDDDPHSIRRGFFHAHMGWLFAPPQRFSKMGLIPRQDLLADPVVRYQQCFLLLGYVVLGGVYPALVGHCLGCGWLQGSLWVGVVARFLSWHCIWSINSVSHYPPLLGVQRFSLRSSAVWVPFIHLLQNGEGHHNYHHQFPSDYRHGIHWSHWDPTKWSIQAWAALGLASQLRTTPTRAIVDARARTLQAKAEALRVHLHPTPPPLSSLPSLSTAEVRRLCAAPSLCSLLLFDGLVLDVGGFDEHPGGAELLRRWTGEDVTEAVRGGIALHTDAAEALMRQMAIATLRTKPTGKAEAEGQEEGESKEGHEE